MARILAHLLPPPRRTVFFVPSLAGQVDGWAKSPEYLALGRDPLAVIVSVGFDDHLCSFFVFEDDPCHLLVPHSEHASHDCAVAFVGVSAASSLPNDFVMDWMVEDGSNVRTVTRGVRFRPCV